MKYILCCIYFILMFIYFEVTDTISTLSMIVVLGLTLVVVKEGWRSKQ